MTEISKMFKNANIKKIHKYQREIDNGDPRFTGIGHSDSYIVYPDFTAEKQLKIVKFILHKGVYYDADGDTYWFHYTDEIENATYRPFEEAIAEFINAIWQDLTDREKGEIRRILNEW